MDHGASWSYKKSSRRSLFTKFYRKLKDEGNSPLLTQVIGGKAGYILLCDPGPSISTLRKRQALAENSIAIPLLIAWVWLNILIFWLEVTRVSFLKILITYYTHTHKGSKNWILSDYAWYGAVRKTQLTTLWIESSSITVTQSVVWGPAAWASPYEMNSTPDLSQNVHFKRNARGFKCTLKFENHCFVTVCGGFRTWPQIIWLSSYWDLGVLGSDCVPPNTHMLKP